MNLVNYFKYILSLILLIYFTTCSNKSNNISLSGNTMGTTYLITISDFKESSDKFKNSIDSLLNIMNNHFSTYKNNSEISIINNSNAELIKVSDRFNYVLDKALDYCKVSGGNYDITIGPIIDLWGFGIIKNNVIPNSNTIRNTLSSVGFEKISLTNNYLMKHDKKVKIDLNSIAKGYAVDEIFKFISNYGYSHFIIEIGGEIRTSKSIKTKDWVIGLQHPETNDIIKKINLNNMSIATSGTYNNYFEQNTVMYSHILNPKTGYPFEYKTVSATVIAKDCIDADALATIAMTLNPNKVIELINKQDNIECYIIEINKNNEILEYKSENFDKFIIF